MTLRMLFLLMNNCRSLPDKTKPGNFKTAPDTTPARRYRPDFEISAGAQIPVQGREMNWKFGLTFSRA